MTPLGVRVTVLALVVASGLSGCSWSGCNRGFVADPSADARGADTPRAALTEWLARDDEGAPERGWRRDRATESGVAFRSGDWTVNVTEAPAGGYLVTSGSCSTSM